MDKASISRYILLVIAVINSVLNLVGYQTIDEGLANNIVAVVSGVYILYCGWKNTYLTSKGIAQKEVLKDNNLL